jgi:ATP-dependent DNA ligase
MKNFIDGVDFWNLEAQKYWSMPSTWDQERKKREVETAIFSGDYIGSRKMDGAFFKFIKDEDGAMSLIGRSKSVKGDYIDKLGHVPQLMPFFNELPNGTCLIGELYFPNNEGSNHVTTIIGCLEAKARERQEKGDKLHYYVFDVLAFDGRALYKHNIEDRVEELNLLWRAYPAEYVEYAKYFEGKELWDQLQSILAEGGEGIVITKKGTCYQPGKRPARQTFKVKKELQETIDVVILGANEPTRIYGGKEIMTWQYWENTKTGERLKGSYYKQYSEGEPIEPLTKNYWNGWAGSLVIGIRKDDKLVVVGSLSGLTEEVLANWKDYKGRVAEITGMQIMDTEMKGIRHPKFIQWRDDLRPSDTDWYRYFSEERS